jgi:hypothetical protein
MHRLTLVVSAHCHLCAEAREDLGRVARRAGVSWTEVDVATDVRLAREYGDRLPVILLDGVEHGYWKVEEDRLLRDLGAG